MSDNSNILTVEDENHTEIFKFDVTNNIVQISSTRTNTISIINSSDSTRYLKYNGNNTWTYSISTYDIIKNDDIEENYGTVTILSNDGKSLLSLNDIKKLKNTPLLDNNFSNNNRGYADPEGAFRLGGSLSKLTIAGKKFTAYVKYNGEFVTIKQAQKLANKKKAKK